MKRYVLTPSAKRDIDDIWGYITNDSVEAADHVLDALESAMTKLATNPSVGHRRAELADRRHRFLLVDSYLIVYRHVRVKIDEIHTFVANFLAQDRQVIAVEQSIHKGSTRG